MKQPGEAAGFDLFISYVRRDVRLQVEGRAFDVVAELKRALESHRRRDPVSGRMRRLRACTDVDDFEVGRSFDDVMRRRIEASRRLLLVCSSGVVGSRHVQHELAIYRSLPGRPRPLAAVLGAPPEVLAPDLFTGEDVAADLKAPDAANRREWRQWLLRESHKIVAQVWELPPREVHDRFEADRRRVRHRIAAASAGVLLLVLALVAGLAGEYGLHRVTVLAMPGRLIAPAGVGFAADGRTPVVIKDDAVLVWAAGPVQPPTTLRLPFRVLRAEAVGPGDIAVAGLREAARLSVPAMTLTHRVTVPGKIEAVAASRETLAVSTQEGDLLLVDAGGRFVAAPRPRSVTHRRFRAFRETGPMRFGALLALHGERWVASVTPDGHLSIFDRGTDAFVTAPQPQFELAPPIEPGSDPVLYETENTRPIGALAFLQDGQLLFGEGAGLRRVDTATGRITLPAHCPMELVRQLHALPDGGVIALTSSTIEVLGLPPGRPEHIACRQRTTLAPKSSPRSAVAADGRTVLIAFFEGAPELWRPTFRLFGVDLPAP